MKPPRPDRDELYLDYLFRDPNPLDRLAAELEAEEFFPLPMGEEP